MSRSIALSLLGLSLLATASAFTASFDHGVAAGDPLSDRVVLWTR
jgi:alkaline phosphatase D